MHIGTWSESQHLQWENVGVNAYSGNHKIKICRLICFEMRQSSTSRGSTDFWMRVICLSPFPVSHLVTPVVPTCVCFSSTIALDAGKFCMIQWVCRRGWCVCCFRRTFNRNLASHGGGVDRQRQSICFDNNRLSPMNECFRAGNYSSR